MTTIARGFIRYIALPVVSAGLIAGAALGVAGTAVADAGNGKTGSTHPEPRSGIVARPDTSVQQPIARFPSKRTERLELWNHNYGH